MKSLKQILFFLGSLTFALLVTVYLHELGHVIGLNIATGQRASIAFNPFQGAATTYTQQSMNQLQGLIVTGGGLFFGSFISLAFSLFVWYMFRSSWAAPFMLIGVLGSGLNALMMLIGTTINQPNDIGRLLELGASPIILICAGIILLLFSGMFLLLTLPYMGIKATTPLRERFLIFIGGMIPYLLCVLVYNYLKQPEKLAVYMTYTVWSLGLTFVAIFVTGWLQPMLLKIGPKKEVIINWPQAVYALLLGVVTLTTIFFIL